MKTRLILSIIFFAAAAAGYAFQWPVEPPILTATFCENRYDHFHGGIDLGGGELEVRPIEEGELIFYFEDGGSPDAIPTGLGNFLVIEHQRGIRSLYAHFKQDSMRVDKVVLDKRDRIGIIGDTGASLGKHLHFEVADKELRQVVNPMRLLPELSDDNAPTINEIRLIQGDHGGKESAEVPLLKGYSPQSGDSISSGVWTALIEVYDISEYVSYFCPMSPYRIQVFLNGQLAKSIVYDGLGEDEGKLQFMQTGDLAFANYYLDDWLVNIGTITIPEGSVIMEFVASDYAGNETSRRVSLVATRQ